MMGHKGNTTNSNETHCKIKSVLMSSFLIYARDARWFSPINMPSPVDFYFCCRNPFRDLDQFIGNEINMV